MASFAIFTPFTGLKLTVRRIESVKIIAVAAQCDVLSRILGCVKAIVFRKCSFPHGCVVLYDLVQRQTTNGATRIYKPLPAMATQPAPVLLVIRINQFSVYV
ncbi:MAG TPA: hypothetical protein VFE02_08505 [Candidatus Acidoferrales bacterium]|jgi:hypothetical protein|nr:hypothetical protein [Candidatus Acidoferrales bacterium]